MKRRILALICAATMVVGMGISASAATSATANEIAAATGEVKVSGADVKLEGTEVQITTSEGADVTFDLHIDVLTAVAAEVAKDAVVPEGATITAADATQVKSIIKEVAMIARFVEKAEVKVVDINSPTAGSFTVNLGVKAGQKVKVLHSLDGGEKFEEIACTVSGGKVTFTAKSFSNYAFVITTGEVQDDDEDEAAAPAAPAAVPTKSPATADAFAAMALLALISGGASAAFGRKSKKN